MPYSDCMAYVAWPAGINQTILFEGYSKNRMPNVIVSQTDAGVQKARRRYTAAPWQHKISLRLERVTPIIGGLTELQAFEEYVHTTLYAGTMNTLFKLPPNTGAQDNISLWADTECRFVLQSGAAPYTVSKLFGNFVYVSFILEEIA